MSTATDHLGNIYCSVKEMCENYKISPSTFYRRIHKMGWSLEKALTTKARMQIHKNPDMDTVNTEPYNNKIRYVTLHERYISDAYSKFLEDELSLLRERLTGSLKEKNTSTDTLSKILDKMELYKKALEKIESEEYFYHAMDLLAYGQKYALQEYISSKEQLEQMVKSYCRGRDDYVELIYFRDYASLLPVCMSLHPDGEVLYLFKRDHQMGSMVEGILSRTNNEN